MAEQRNVPSIFQKQNIIPSSGMRRPGSQTNPETALTMKDVYAIVRRHIWLIICMTILGIILGGASWQLLLRFYPMYTAQGLIEVLPPVDTDPLQVISPVLQKDLMYGQRVKIVALIRQQWTLMQLLNRDNVRTTNWYKKFAKEDNQDKALRKALKDLKKHLNVIAARDGDYVSVSMTCHSAKDAALIVNEMVAMFVRSRGVEGDKDADVKLATLNARKLQVERELNALQGTLDSYVEEVKRKTGFSDLEDRDYKDTITLKLDGLQTQVDELDLDIAQTYTLINTLENQATGPINEQIENQIESDPTNTLLTQQIANFESQLSGLLTKFGDNHRTVRQFKELIAETKLRRESRRVEIAEQVRQSNLQNGKDNLVILQGKMEQLTKLYKKAFDQKTDFDYYRMRYEKKKTERDERRTVLDEILAAIESRKAIKDDPASAKIKSLGDSPEPTEVSFPKAIIFLPGGMVLGLILGFGLAFLIEMLNDLVRTPRDVIRYLRVPLLAVVPNTKEDPRLRKISSCEVLAKAPYSLISESYRKLRINLSFTELNHEKQVLLISAGMARDGQTPVAVNLAASMAAENKKVVIVDTNFRQPSLQNVLSSSDAEDVGYGFSDVLIGTCQLADAIRPTIIKGVQIIETGTLPPNPAELLATSDVKGLLDQLRQSYDCIILDGPPVLLVSDAKVLANYVDAAILVFNAASTRRGAAQRTIREIADTRVPVLGCVLYNVIALKGGYFQEQFRVYNEYQKKQLAHSV